MGNHQSQSSAELAPAWSRTVPRDRAGRLLSYGAPLPSQHRVPGQKLHLSPSLPLDEIDVENGALSRVSTYNRSAGHLVAEGGTNSLQRTPSQLHRFFGSEPDLRRPSEPPTDDQQGAARAPRPGLLRRRRPPQLTLPPPPPPAQLITELGTPPTPRDRRPQPAGRRRLFRRQPPRPGDAAARGRSHTPTARAGSEERSQLSGADEDWRTRSVGCLQVALGESHDTPENSSVDCSVHSRSDGSGSNERRLPGEEDRPGSPKVNGGQRYDRHENEEEGLPASLEENSSCPSYPARSSEPRNDEGLGHRIKIKLNGSTDVMQTSQATEINEKPKQFFFGMEHLTSDRVPQKHFTETNGKLSALTKVKRNEEVDIIGRRVIYQRQSELASESCYTEPLGETTRVVPTVDQTRNRTSTPTKNIKRIPTQKFQDFMTSLERGKRIQLSVSKEEILTNSRGQSSGNVSSPTASEVDMELRVGADSISMHLRPTLPKKQQQIPRFSPLAAWKSLEVDESASREWRDHPASRQPLRDQLSKHRPITRSADSGIGGETAQPPASPEDLCRTRIPEESDDQGVDSPTSLRGSTERVSPLWTPAQDLDVSSGDDHSLQMEGQRLSTLPKLTQRSDMFRTHDQQRSSGRHGTGGSSRGAAREVHSLRSADRCRQAGAFNRDPTTPQQGSLDPNWLLSRSVPNSLNDVDVRADSSRRRDELRSDVGLQVKQHGVYLPEFHSMRVERGRSVSPVGDHGSGRRASSPALSAGDDKQHVLSRNSAAVSSRKKFAFQSTVRLIEKKKLEARLTREASERERQRQQELEAMQRVEREFQLKRAQESQQLLQIHQRTVQESLLRREEPHLGEDSPAEADHHKPAANITSSDITSSHSSSERSDVGFSSHKESSQQSSPRSGGPPAAAAPRTRVLPHDEHCWEPPPDYGSLPEPLPEPEPEPAACRTHAEHTAKKPGFLAGVKKLLRGKKEWRDMSHVRREEPEGQAAGAADQLLTGGGGGDWTRAQSPGRPARLELAEDWEGVGSGRSPVSSADSAPRPLSSGYESGPSLDSSRRRRPAQMTAEHGERETGGGGGGGGGGARPPAHQHRYQKHQQQLNSRSSMGGRPLPGGGGRPTTPVWLGSPPSGGARPTTPVWLGSPPSGGARPTTPVWLGGPADRRRQPPADRRPVSGALVGVHGEPYPAGPLSPHGNYRRAFAWGAPPHALTPAAAAAAAAAAATAAPPERNCRTPIALTARAAQVAPPERRCRTPTPLHAGGWRHDLRPGVAPFQRSRSHHELHHRGRPAPGGGPLPRGRSEERLDAPCAPSGGVQPAWTPAVWPCPAHAHPALLQHRGYMPHYINSSPARFAHGMELGSGAGPRAHHQGPVGPPRPASAFAV